MTVTMKDGTVIRGPLWEWQPEEGWFQLVGDEDMPDRIWLRDVQSAVNHGQRTSVDKVENVDLLDRARREGWNPCDPKP